MATILVNGSTLVVDDGNGTDTDITIGEITGFSLSGGQNDVIDVTNFASTRKEKRVGLADYGSGTISVNFDVDNAGQDELKTIRDSQVSREFTLTLPEGTDVTGTFTAFVTNFNLDGQVGGVWTGTFDIEITGDLEFA